jgi:hypothetical protein
VRRNPTHTHLHSLCPSVTLSEHPCLAVDFALKIVPWEDNKNIRLQLWDIAGQERFSSMTRVYYKQATACVIIFDITRRSTFQVPTQHSCPAPQCAPPPSLRRDTTSLFVWALTSVEWAMCACVCATDAGGREVEG